MMAQVSKEREMRCKDENLNMPKERKIGSTETSKQKSQEFSVQIWSQSRSWDVHARPLAFVEDVKFITVRGIHINKDNVDMGDKERYI